MNVRTYCKRCGLIEERTWFTDAKFTMRLYRGMKRLLCPYCVWDCFGIHPDKQPKKKCH